jgi:hypothetical protein
MRQRYIQDPVTHKLIPADEWHQTEVNAPMVMSDIKPYKSMIDGKMIESRSVHRAHLKQHNMIEIGNETKHHLAPKPRERDKTIRPAVVEAMKRHGLL